MTKRLIPLALLALAACNTGPGGTGLTAPPSIGPGEPARWFYAASQIRRCGGPDSRDGTFWAAVAAGIGGIVWFRDAPRIVTSGASGRRRADSLMQAAYAGRFTRNVNMTCRRLMAATGRAYTQAQRSTRSLVARLAARMLRTDEIGQVVLQNELARSRKRQANRRTTTNRRRATGIRRPSLQPGEQQVPLKN